MKPAEARSVVQLTRRDLVRAGAWLRARRLRLAAPDSLVEDLAHVDLAVRGERVALRLQPRQMPVCLALGQGLHLGTPLVEVGDIPGVLHSPPSRTYSAWMPTVRVAARSGAADGRGSTILRRLSLG
jgi:hypothetical protein